MPKAPKARTRIERGIERLADGTFRAYVSVGSAQRHKRWPAWTGLQEMRDWRARVRAALQQQHRRAHPTPGGFRAEALSYLAAVRAMPSYRDRARDIGLWIDMFGDRARDTITSADIRRQRDAWLLSGPRRVLEGKTWTEAPGPLAASTVNHRLRALENLWTVLDGRQAPNPVREVPEAVEPDAEPRGLPHALVTALLAAMPDRGVAAKGETRPAVSQSKARLAAIAYTGLPHRQLAALKPEHVDWTAGSMLVPGRRKGKGTRMERRPLTEKGLEALRALEAAGAWGPFSNSALHKAFRRACRRVEAEARGKGILLDLSGLRPYDLRHSFASEVLAATGSQSAVTMLLGHRSPKTSERYSLAAVPAAMAAAIEQLNARLTAGNPASVPAKRRKR